MDVLSLCPLPVGILRWQSPAPSLTIVVKATFTLDKDGYAPLAAQQEPLWLDRAAAQAAFSELEAATDFAPFKPRVDVLVTGHARAPAPARAIPVRLGVNALNKQFFAIATEPAVSLPLADAYLRTGASPAAASARVKARAPWSPERAAFAGARLVGPEGLPIAPLPAGFDYRFFNAAPPDQQVDMPPTNALLVLEGLLPGAPARRARLPGSYPRVFCVPHGEDPRRSTPAEVVMRCDTLWIDADRALCTLTWRGVIGMPAEPGTLIVALERHGQAQSWASICGQLEVAAQVRAVEVQELIPRDSAPGRAWGQAPPGRLDPGHVHAVAKKHSREAEPGDAGEHEERTMVRQSVAALVGTLSAGLVPVARASTLPFVPPTALPTAEGVRRGEETLVPRLEQVRAPAMPFREEPRRGVEALAATVVPVREGAASAEKRALPFLPGSPSPVEALRALTSAQPRAPSTETTRVLARTEPPPAWRSGGELPFMAAGHISARAAAKRAEPPMMSLELCGAIRADIWAGGARHDVLERHGVSELEWEMGEQRQMEMLEREAREGRADTALAMLMALDVGCRVCRPCQRVQLMEL